MRIGDTPDTVDELPARSVRHGRPAGPPTLLAALVLLVGGVPRRPTSQRTAAVRSLHDGPSESWICWREACEDVRTASIAS
jgi:hypothetical protein